MKKHLEMFGVDLRSIALFRITLGFFFILDCLMRWSDLTAHYTDGGLLPRAPFIEKFANVYHMSLLMANGEAVWSALCLLAGIVVGLGLMVGHKSRLMAFLGWVILVSIQNRNPMILNGGDVLFRMLFFWAMFLPLGRRFSIDQALQQNRDVDRNQSQLYFGGGALALIMQVAIVYWATALLKTGKEWWPDGTASYYALALDQFTTPFGMWMSQQYELLRVGTYAVYFLELLGPFFFFMPFFFGPLRTLAVLAFMGLHFNFDLSMRLGVFPWIDIVSLTALLPAWFWDQLSRFFSSPSTSPSRSKSVQIYYDEECVFCRKMALLVRVFIAGSQATVESAQQKPKFAAKLAAEKSWIVVDHEGTAHYRYDALLTVLHDSPYWGWLARRLPLASLQNIADAVYHLIATNRPFLGRLTARFLPLRTSSMLPGWPSHILAIIALVYVIVWNIKTIPQFNFNIPLSWETPAQLLRLDQKWNMFAPYPLKDDGWYVAPGRLVDGTEIDAFKAQQAGLDPSDAVHDYPPVTWEKPEQVSLIYKNSRWRKYMMNIWQKRRRAHRLYYGKYLCRAFNQDRPQEKKLATFKLVFVKEFTQPLGQPQPTERVTIWSHDCFKKQSTPQEQPQEAPAEEPKAASPQEQD